MIGLVNLSPAETGGVESTLDVDGAVMMSRRRVEGLQRLQGVNNRHESRRF